MAARDSQKSREAIKRLKEETGKDVTLIPIDLSDLHNVRKAGEAFLRYVVAYIQNTEYSSHGVVTRVNSIFY